MNPQAAIDKRDLLEKQGTVTVAASQFLTENELKTIEEQIGRFTFWRAKGDANEPCDLLVSELLMDKAGEMPRRVQEDVSGPTLEILLQEKVTRFFAALLGGERHIRRVQFNKMVEGSFLGRHCDLESNPDYDAAVVVHFGSRYAGGEFVSYRRGHPPVRVRGAYLEATITKCALPHEVLAVTGGERTGLTFFLSGRARDQVNLRKLS